MRRAVATVSLSGTLRQKLEAIAAARFDAIELFEPDFIGFDGDARALRSMADDLGLAIDLYQPLRDFEGVPDAVFRRNLDRAERKFDLMQTLGAPLLLVCSNTAPTALHDAERAAEQLHALADRAARRNLRIGYEALAWGRWVKLYGEAWEIVQTAAHPHLGLILDSFHTLSLGDSPDGIADIPGEKIFFVQMADAPWMAMDVLQWARHHRNFPGQGQLDVEHFFEQVLRSGYAGTLSLEIFNDVFRSTPNRRTALDAMRSLLWLESQARARLEAEADADSALARRALGQAELFDPPDAPAFDGVAFVEFGVDDATGAALGVLLGQLGFRRVGWHRSKAVSLYRQRGIRLVVNQEPGSEARARFDEQGALVCTVGLATADPRRAAHRGSALLSARRDAARRPDELALPAIVAPGGTLLQFVSSGDALDADFIFEAQDDDGEDAGLEAVDHLAFGVGQDQLDTWMLFSRAVLGLERGDSLELADPFGLIRSCGVANAERSLRFVVNVSLGERTRTARQLQAAGRSGAGVHHIALASADIFATVASLRGRGVRFVPISGNYYDDLIARLDLEATLVERMRSLGILYDTAAGGGCYFHAYTEPFDDRFFFEVVQRERYDGYGAVNAPARMASQEQSQAVPRRA